MLKRGLYCLMRLFSSASASLFVVDLDVIDVARFGDQRAGFRFRQPVFVEVAADAAAKILRFADVDDACRAASL